MSAILALDVGGTSIKHGLFCQDAGLLEGTFGITPVDAEADEGGLRSAWVGLLRKEREAAARLGHAIAAVGVSMAGPLDYRAGISLMRHKYPALYQKPLRPWFEEALPGAAVGYLHDASAFLLGEACDGCGQGASDMAGVTLGTGLGVAVMRGGRILVTPALLPVLSLWSAPFRGGTAEDAVSARGIRRRYAERSNRSDVPDVRRISELAREGDGSALATMRETGEMLAEILSPRLSGLPCEALILGGRIARAADLFLDALAKNLPMRVCASSLQETAALYGGFRYVQLGHASTMIET